MNKCRWTVKELYWYWLASTPGIGIASIFRVAQMGFSLEELFTQPRLIENNTLHFSEQIKHDLKSRANISLLLEEVDKIERAGICIRTAISPGYPQRLKDLWRPPAIIYTYGKLQNFPPKCIGIVCSRYTSRKGAAAARELASTLAEQGITIVSGMARGIDTQGHWGALEVGAQTIAVLGCGADIIYPKENAELYAQICENGMIVSEYAPGIKPNPRHFPLRNRIIAGLCQELFLVKRDYVAELLLL